MATVTLLFILAFLIMSNGYAKCERVNYWTGRNEWAGKEFIAEYVCADDPNANRTCIDRIVNGWARIVVDKKMLYYFSKDKNGKWRLIAKGKSFNIEMWDKLGIPSQIR